MLKMFENKTARIEIDLDQLRQNLQILKKEMPQSLQWWAVVKDQAYGHGAIEVGREVLKAGASKLAVATLEESLDLKKNLPEASVVIFGERSPQELETCIENQVEFFVNDVEQAKLVSEMGKKHRRAISVHIEMDTGLSRYGIRWDKCLALIDFVSTLPMLHLSSVMTHFAMSDELDKTFANLQLERFLECVPKIKKINSNIFVHACNSGGYLDLPQAHLDLVRLGILPLGVYPSEVCRRVDGVLPVMSMKTCVASIRKLEVGDVVGYGMHYKATQTRTIAVLPMGYSKGYPRLRNKGHVLIRGKQAPVIGGNAMNAMMVDVTDIPNTTTWDEVVLVGKQGSHEITMRDLASWAGTVPYDVMSRAGQLIARVYR